MKFAAKLFKIATLLKEGGYTPNFSKIDHSVPFFPALSKYDFNYVDYIIDHGRGRARFGKMERTFSQFFKNVKRLLQINPKGRFEILEKKENVTLDNNVIADIFQLKRAGTKFSFALVQEVSPKTREPLFYAIYTDKPKMMWSLI